MANNARGDKSPSVTREESQRLFQEENMSASVSFHGQAADRCPPPENHRRLELPFKAFPGRSSDVGGVLFEAARANRRRTIDGQLGTLLKCLNSPRLHTGIPNTFKALTRSVLTHVSQRQEDFISAASRQEELVRTKRYSEHSSG